MLSVASIVYKALAEASQPIRAKDIHRACEDELGNLSCLVPAVAESRITGRIFIATALGDPGVDSLLVITARVRDTRAMSSPWPARTSRRL